MMRPNAGEAEFPELSSRVERIVLAASGTPIAIDRPKDLSDSGTKDSKIV
jgi:hypothetical protein